MVLFLRIQSSSHLQVVIDYKKWFQNVFVKLPIFMTIIMSYHIDAYTCRYPHNTQKIIKEHLSWHIIIKPK
jgi:hypothetical protein